MIQEKYTDIDKVIFHSVETFGFNDQSILTREDSPIPIEKQWICISWNVTTIFLKKSSVYFITEFVINFFEQIKGCAYYKVIFLGGREYLSWYRRISPEGGDFSLDIDIIFNTTNFFPFICNMAYTKSYIGNKVCYHFFCLFHIHFYENAKFLFKLLLL